MSKTDYASPPNARSGSGAGAASSSNPFLDSLATASSSAPGPSTSPSNPFRSQADAAATAYDKPPVPVPITSPAPASSHDPLDVALPDEPPPAYTPAAGQSGSTTIGAGPARMDFSGPPPLPERMTQPQSSGQGGHGQGSHHNYHPPPPGPPPARPMEANITGVGIGYGPRVHAQDTGAGSGSGSGSALHMQSNPTGGSWNGAQSPPPPPPTQAPPQQQQQQDMTPTEVPTPGRPLLWKGMLLVYPKGFWCQKCGNTGFKQMDPSNPHETDWKKYGKKFTSALAHSYTLSPSATGNPSTTTAQNFQRPLPAHNGGGGWHQPPSHAQARPPPQPQPQSQSQHGNSVWDHPGHNRPPPPPPGQYGPGPGPGPGHGPRWGPPPMQPQAPPMIMTGSGWVPANAMVVRPGDPRLGG